MFNSITLALLFVFFFLRSFFHIVFLVRLWQTKEYRLDRMVSHLKTAFGKQLVFGKPVQLEWIAIVLFILFPKYDLFYRLLVGLLFAAEASFSIWKYLIGQLKRPKWGPRTFGVYLSTLLIIMSISFLRPISIPVWLMIIDRMTFPATFLTVFLFNILFGFYEKILVQRARIKLANVSPQVIGLTGSYGKTSTKEFLYTILSSRFHVTKTKSSQNTIIGIAETILQTVRKETEVFVVEMGAYKRGEIKALCQIVHPKIGIVTGINEQHMELFKNLGNTVKAKYELIDSLPKNGTAILNLDNPFTKKMAEWVRNEGKQIITYTTDVLLKDYIVRGEKIKASRDGLEFTMNVRSKKRRVRTTIQGKHLVENILAAVSGGLAIGMTFEEIVKQVVKLDNPRKTLEKVKSPTRAVWIDDSFNSNPTGVQAALNYMKLFDGTRILIFQPLIELGSKAKGLHYMLGKEMGIVCDYVILTNANFYSQLINGFNETKKKNAFMKKVTAITLQILLEKRSSNDVVVFEGREAGTVLDQMTNANRIRI